MATDCPLLSCEDECRLLLDMARRSSNERMAQQLRIQAEMLAGGVEAHGSWAFELIADDFEDGPISTWLIDHGSCGVCGQGYIEHDRVLFVRPSVCAHARCILAALPRSEADLDAELAAMAAGRSA